MSSFADVARDPHAAHVVSVRPASIESPTPPAPPTPVASVAPRRLLLAAAGAIALFAAAYSNSFRNRFHFDDVHVIEQNLFIRDLANVPRFFTDAQTFSALPQNQTYRPVTSLSLALDYALAGGLNPPVFHATQLLLFAALGVLLAFFLDRIFRDAGRSHPWAALLAATLFCVHTANTQTGNYISARSEILSALGVIGAFLLYRRPAWRRYHLYLLAIIAGALAKNLAVMFAPLLLAYQLLIEQQLSFRDVFTRRGWPRVKPALRSSLPAFVLSAALFVLVESMNPPGQNYGGGGRLAYLVTQMWVWVRYAGLFVVPVGLTADTDMTLLGRVLDPRALAGLLLLAASLAAAWLASRTRRWRPAAFGILWFWIALVPTSSVFPLAEVTNDHRVFFPFIGLALATMWTLALLIDRANAGFPSLARRITIASAAASLLLLGAHAVGTFERNKVWRDDETLWSDVVRKSPRNGRALMNYGLSHMRRGRLAEARELFTRARALSPNYSYLEINLGVVNAAMGDQATAETHFRRALELEPAQPVVHRFYARWLVDQGRGPLAMDHLRRVLALSPGDTEARHALMRLYAAAGSRADLRELAAQTLALVGTDTLARTYAAGGIPFPAPAATGIAWFRHALTFTRSGQHVEAAQLYRAAVDADANDPDAWTNLGWTLGKLGFFDRAVPALERAVVLRPHDPLARNNLAWARAEAGRRTP